MSIVMDAWAQAHKLKVRPLPVTGAGVVRVAAFNGMPQPMAGMTEFVLQVGSGVELMLKGVMVLAGNNYQGILGADVWMGRLGVLGSIVATLPSRKELGRFTWHVEQAGVHAHVPFLPLSGRCCTPHLPSHHHNHCPQHAAHSTPTQQPTFPTGEVGHAGQRGIPAQLR